MLVCAMICALGWTEMTARFVNKHIAALKVLLLSVIVRYIPAARSVDVQKHLIGADT